MIAGTTKEDTQKGVESFNAGLLNGQIKGNTEIILSI